MKTVIAESFLKLWENMDYKDITITMICRNVPISRTAFYHYFPDKLSILYYCVARDYEQNCLPVFRFHLKETGTACFFSYIADHPGFYQKLFDLDDGVMLYRCLKAAYRVGFERRKEFSMPAPGWNTPFDPEVFFEYSCSGIAAVVTAWIRKKMQTPVNQIARDLYIMMSENLSDVRDRYT